MSPSRQNRRNCDVLGHIGAGFLILSQCLYRPARCGVPSRFRHDALAAQRASMFVDHRALTTECLVEGNAVMLEPQQTGQPAFSPTLRVACSRSATHHWGRFRPQNRSSVIVTAIGPAGAEARNRQVGERLCRSLSGHCFRRRQRQRAQRWPVRRRSSASALA